MEEEGLMCICQTIAKSRFISISYRSPFLFKAVIQSWDTSVWEIMPKLVWWFSDFMLIFSADCSWSSSLSVCVCEMGSHLQSKFSQIMQRLHWGGGINLSTSLVILKLSKKWFAYKEASIWTSFKSTHTYHYDIQMIICTNSCILK